MMRKAAPWILLAIAAAAIAGLLLPAENAAATDSAAALGLMLLEDEKGVYVLAVSTGSAAEQAGISPGDRITHVQGEPLTQAAALDETIAGAEEITLDVGREGKNLQIVIPLR